MSLELKQKLHALCLEQIEASIALEKKALIQVEEAAERESKSSVGDKYETGRAMMHIEAHKHKAQIAKYLQQKTILDQIDVSVLHTAVVPGAIVYTNSGNYFITIGMGDIECSGTHFCTMSLGSPLGKEFAHKKAGDAFQFRGKWITINSVM